jgi:hypothetical protein
MPLKRKYPRKCTLRTFGISPPQKNERFVLPPTTPATFNMSRCEPNPDGQVHSSLISPTAHRFTNPGSWYYLEYARCQQTWVCRKVYRFSTNTDRVNITTPCTVIHVRRSDIVLHCFDPHEIDDYVKAVNNGTKKLFC